MAYLLMADLLVLVHLAFVGFVVLGGALLWWWPRLVWVHLPAVIWAIGIEWSGAVCPLTPWENWLRARAGMAGYEGDFVAQYLLPMLYPLGLTRTVQVVLGSLVLIVNGLVYWRWWRRGRAATL